MFLVDHVFYDNNKRSVSHQRMKFHGFNHVRRPTWFWNFTIKKITNNRTLEAAHIRRHFLSGCFSLGRLDFEVGWWLTWLTETTVSRCLGVILHINMFSRKSFNTLCRRRSWIRRKTWSVNGNQTVGGETKDEGN